MCCIILGKQFEDESFYNLTTLLRQSIQMKNEKGVGSWLYNKREQLLRKPKK